MGDPMDMAMLDPVAVPALPTSRRRLEVGRARRLEVEYEWWRRPAWCRRDVGDAPTSRRRLDVGRARRLEVEYEWERPEW